MLPWVFPRSTSVASTAGGEGSQLEEAGPVGVFGSKTWDKSLSSAENADFCKPVNSWKVWNNSTQPLWTCDSTLNWGRRCQTELLGGRIFSSSFKRTTWQMSRNELLGERKRRRMSLSPSSPRHLRPRQAKWVQKFFLAVYFFLHFFIWFDNLAKIYLLNCKETPWNQTINLNAIEINISETAHTKTWPFQKSPQNASLL